MLIAIGSMENPLTQTAHLTYSGQTDTIKQSVLRNKQTNVVHTKCMLVVIHICLYNTNNSHVIGLKYNKLPTIHYMNNIINLFKLNVIINKHMPMDLRLG